MTATECVHPDCNQTFSTTGGMRAHCVQVHQATVLQWVECDWCGHRFTANDYSGRPRFCDRTCSDESRMAMQRARVQG